LKIYFLFYVFGGQKRRKKLQQKFVRKLEICFKINPSTYLKSYRKIRNGKMEKSKVENGKMENKKMKNEKRKIRNGKWKNGK
jgi:hypothetical protein